MSKVSRLSFSGIVKEKAPKCSGVQMKDLVRLAYSKFLDLVAVEEGCTVPSVCRDLNDSTFGQKAMLPTKWEQLAWAAVEHVLSPASSAFPTGDIQRDDSSESSRIPAAKKQRVAFVAEEEHGDAKDAANTMWIAKLRAGSKIFFLDSWKSREGLQLRTTNALLRAGHMAQNLFSANPDQAIVAQLLREGVVAWAGDWASFPPQIFDGIYLDLCSGSWAYLSVQLELATARAAPGCVLGITVTERDFGGEPLLLRALRLQEFLTNLGWAPAMQSLHSSTLLHRSGTSRQQVLTQFWAR